MTDNNYTKLMLTKNVVQSLEAEILVWKSERKKLNEAIKAAELLLRENKRTDPPESE